MSKDFENIVKDIQEKIERDEEANFSKKVIDEYRNPINFGTIPNADATGEIKGPCGDTMKITLKIRNNTITKARFWTDGCGPSIACGNKLTKLIIGKTLEESSNITSEDLNKALDGLPDDHMHCTLLAVNTLLKCIKSYQNKVNQ